MEFAEMQRAARAVQERYTARDVQRCGRAWTTGDTMLGFVGDVGDLAKLIQAKEGVRPTDDLDARMAHELSDCLWSVLVLADAVGVDLEAAFMGTMDELAAGLDSTSDLGTP